MKKRTYWLDETLAAADATGDSINSGDPRFVQADLEHDRKQVETYGEANLISSYVTGEGDDALHRPALDLDFKAQLFESRSGHYHLYLSKHVTWSQYVKLLEVMGEIGLLEEGYVSASKARGMTFLRVPVVRA